jgi:hypothetical protein
VATGRREHGRERCNDQQTAHHPTS